MDVDLSTGLDALLPLVAPLLSGHSDVAIGSRLAPGAHVVRGARRELISRGYNLLLRAVLRSPCTDAQCGFKAMRRDAATRLLPLVEDQAWFFDTELLITAAPPRPAHPRGAGRLGGRPRLAGAGGAHRLARPLRYVAGDGTGVPAEGRHGEGPAADRRRTPPVGHGGDTVRAPDRLGSVVPSPTPGRRGDPVFADDLLRFAGVGAASTLAYVGVVRGPRALARELPGQPDLDRPVQRRQPRSPPGDDRSRQTRAPTREARPDGHRPLRRELGSHHRRARRDPGRRAHRARPRAGRGHPRQPGRGSLPVRHPPYPRVPATIRPRSGDGDPRRTAVLCRDHRGRRPPTGHRGAR